MTEDNGRSALQGLISAAGGDDAAIRAAVLETGVAQAVSVLVDELVSRADLGDLPRHGDKEVTVRFLVGFDDETVVHHVQSADLLHEHGPEGTDTPDVTVELGLVELVRAVFGPEGAGGRIGRRVSWRDFEDPMWFVTAHDARGVLQRLLRGLDATPADLTELSLRMKSDKWGLHFYTAHYERHFAPLRNRPITVLELGIGGYGDPAAGGGSLRMWKRFFPRAMVYGVDVFDKHAVDEQRITTVRGDMSDAGFLQSLAAQHGPFDIVVDDGSHYCPDVTLALRTLFPHVRPGGLYVIEDLQTSYWPGYGGSTERRNDPATSMGLLKQLVDGLNHAEFEPAGWHEATETDRTLTGVHFYHNLAFLEKGTNEDGTVPAWMGRKKSSYEEMATLVFPTRDASRDAS